MRYVTKRNGDVVPLDIHKIKKVIKECCEGTSCSEVELELDAQVLFTNKIKTSDIQKSLIQTAVEKVSIDNPEWQYVAAKLLMCDINKDILTRRRRKTNPYLGFTSMVKSCVKKGLYSDRMLEEYSEEDYKELESYIKPERDFLFNYAGLKTLKDRYLVKDYDGKLMELPQECFMSVAMFLAIPEKDKVKWAKEFYDILSKHEVMVATPTLSNARKPLSQLSSCFVGTVDDSLDSIMDNVNNFAQLSKYGGGVGLDISTVRAQGSEIRGFPNCSGGTVPWIRILNDTAVAVDQLGCVHNNSYVKVLKKVVTSNFEHDFFRERDSSLLNSEDLVLSVASHASNYAFEYSSFSKNTVSSLLLDYVLNKQDAKSLAKKYNMSWDQYKKIIVRYKKIDKELPDDFKRLAGFSDYALSSSGLVINTHSMRPLSIYKDRKGYTRVSIGKTAYTLHRLLYNTFVRQIGENETIDHIDGNKDNNSIWNLEAVTNEENISKGWEGTKSKRLEMARIRKHLTQGYRLQGDHRGTPDIDIKSLEWKVVPISSVRTGSLILSYNSSTQTVEYKPVVAKYKIDVKQEDQVKISTSSGNHIITSNWHPYPVFTEKGELVYKRSDLINIGDLTVDEHGCKIEVTSVSKPDASIDFIDLTVKDNNNYFCSTGSQEGSFNLIHNTRKGALTLHQAIWHEDIMDFFDLKTNNGDDRRKAHDIFPQVGIPDIFMQCVLEKKDFATFDPYMVRKHLGFELSDFYGEEFTEKYKQVVRCKSIKKTYYPALELFKKLLKSCFETGLPYVFFRDTANLGNPNKHCGLVRSSNLCMEINQNMSPSSDYKEEVIDGVSIRSKVPGDLVVCNLSSVNLFRVHKDEDLERIIPIQTRMLDNVIDLNFYPLKEAEVTNQKYRAIGLGTMGYHAWMANQGIRWESEENLEETSRLYEKIAYHTVKASCDLAKEKGKYSMFEGSDWENGNFFGREEIGGELDWSSLKKEVKENGLRNGYLLATAPTGSISIIAGSTAGIDPVFDKVERVEKKDGILVSALPGLDDKTMWLYKAAHTIDQTWVVSAASERQKWIDQSQSLNLFIHPDLSAKQLASYYIDAWKKGCKTVYYMRSKAVEVEEICESCAG